MDANEDVVIRGRHLLIAVPSGPETDHVDDESTHLVCRSASGIGLQSVVGDKFPDDDDDDGGGSDDIDGHAPEKKASSVFASSVCQGEREREMEGCQAD